MFTYVFGVFHCRASNQQNRNDWECESFELIFMAKFTAWVDSKYTFSVHLLHQRDFKDDETLNTHLYNFISCALCGHSWRKQRFIWAFTRPGIAANGIWIKCIEIAKCVKRKVNFYLRRNWCIQRFRLQLHVANCLKAKNFEKLSTLLKDCWCRMTCNVQRKSR